MYECIVLDAVYFFYNVKGRHVDKDGNIRIWWDPESIEIYDTKSKCIVEQFNNFFVPSVNMTVRNDLELFFHDIFLTMKYFKERND